MVPTADQIAHAVVAASRAFKADPIKVLRHAFVPRGEPGAVQRSRALSYAVLAIADKFENDQMASRLVGLTSSRVGTIRWQLSKGALHWWDPKILELVKEAIPDAPAAPPVRASVPEAPDLPPGPKNAPVPALRKPAGLPAQNYGTTIGGMGPPRAYSPSRDLVGEKKGLRDQLAEAVRNTAKMPSQN